MFFKNGVFPFRMDRLASIANEMWDQEMVHVAVGVRPSGSIHLGNICTLALASLFAHVAGNHRSQVNLTVCDLDAPDYAVQEGKQTGVVRYAAQLEPPRRVATSTRNLLEFFERDLQVLVRDLNAATGVDIRTRRLSDIQRNPGYRTGLQRVLETPGTMDVIYTGTPDRKTYVWPVCPECKSTNYENALYRKGALLSSCVNSECPQERLEARVEDRSGDIAVHHLIDPLRDRTVKPFADVHVFGGDYRHVSPHRRLSNVDVTQYFTKVASGGEAPVPLLGPLIEGPSGAKMSKSLGNGWTLNGLRRSLGRSYMGAVLGLVEHAMNEGMESVPYHALMDHLTDRNLAFRP
jgi:lysyl-tRNA synthetase class I